MDSTCPRFGSLNSPLWCGLLLALISPGHSLAENPPQAQRAGNRLANESSPYLLLHAKNPVDWYPWGPEALAKAKAENKPIFLSIGYSSCFWCHVMERKVFENAEIAAYMNEHFVNIKVDREERPDIDDLYMLSLQVYFQLAGANQGGGWPLSMFLTPDGKPIAGGTYFPPEDMQGRPGFLNVSRQIVNAWENQREAVRRTADVITAEVARLSRPSLPLQAAELNQGLVQAAIDAVTATYDPEHGGFGFSPNEPDAPKFPVPVRLMLIQAQIGADGNGEKYAAMLDKTLEEIGRGGIRDHLGGGFHRYSTDRQWLVPHFEKMLYDNAQLADVYLEAFRRTNRDFYRQAAVEALEFILSEMTDTHGSFHSALDAETNGVEGQYYVWSKAELEQLLTPEELRLFAPAYGVDGPPNFEQSYVLHLPRPLNAVAEQLDMPVADLKLRLTTARQTLLKARSRRPPLLKDDKILTSWNGLMIGTLAKAGKLLNEKRYLSAAEQASIQLLSTHRDQEGRLLHTSRGGKAQLPAYLDDYAFLVSGLIALYEATGTEKWLTVARRLTDDQIAMFWDADGGGFNFTSVDHEQLLARTKNAYDSVLPSGNSVTVRNLVFLSRTLNIEDYRNRAAATLKVFAPQLKATPANLTYLALALQEYLHWNGGAALANSPQGNLFDGGISSPRPPSPGTMTKPATPGEAGRTQVTFTAVAAAGEEHKIVAEGFLPFDRLTPGSAIPVLVRIAVDEGWHINANPAQPDFVIPTELSVVGPSAVTIEAVKYPQGKPFQITGFDDPVNVYEGIVELRGTLKLPADLMGPQKLTLQVRYQACNNESCLRPMKLLLTAELPVAVPDQPARSINSALFPAAEQ